MRTPVKPAKPTFLLANHESTRMVLPSLVIWISSLACLKDFFKTPRGPVTVHWRSLISTVTAQVTADAATQCSSKVAAASQTNVSYIGKPAVICVALAPQGDTFSFAAKHYYWNRSWNWLA